jgi:NADH dehydrogenase
MSSGATKPNSSGAPRVVIIGAGFAGLYAARAFAHAPVDLVVIDRTNHHVFQPLLYQAATAVLATNDIAVPIRWRLRNQRNTSVVLGDVTSIDLDARTVTIDREPRTLSYDYLLIATGARHAYFGHPEWERIAPGLKTIDDALEVRRRFLLAFERAEWAATQAERDALLTFVIVGGGPTGVEVAGALAEVRNFALRRDFRHINPRSATVMLIEAGPRILATYPEELSEKAVTTLRSLGVEVRTSTMVTDVRPDCVKAGNWTIPTRTVVWAAGNVASPIVKSIGCKLDRQGRAVVEPDCTVPGHRELFVLGDAAAFRQEDGSTVPGVCPAAIQMGQYAARTIRAEVGRKDAPARKPFRYWDKGQLAVIGRGHAVADIGKFHFSGILAWLAWVFVHIFFLIGFRNRVIVLTEWAFAYLTYQRGARLITGETAEYSIPAGSKLPAVDQQPVSAGRA